MDERIEQIEKLANELRKLAYGAGGQCVEIMENNQRKHELGKKCLEAVKEYKKWHNETFGGLE